MAESVSIVVRRRGHRSASLSSGEPETPAPSGPRSRPEERFTGERDPLSLEQDSPREAYFQVQSHGGAWAVSLSRGRLVGY